MIENAKQFYINGEWVEPFGTGTLDVINPANEQPLNAIAMGNEADVDRAVAAAKTAFESFSQTTKEERIALSRKFGASPEEAERLLLRAAELGLKPIGLSFHVGRQMRDPEGWAPTLSMAATTWKRLALRGLRLTLLNLGGGFPARYDRPTMDAAAYGAHVRALVEAQFGDLAERIIAEPGRGMVAEAGVVEAEVVLATTRSDGRRWVYLDLGKFNGLAETMDEAIRYRLVTDRDGAASGPCVLAGPTCDSADILYERQTVDLPLDLAEGDRILIPSTGAYTSAYAAPGFNGVPALREEIAGER